LELAKTDQEAKVMAAEIASQKAQMASMQALLLASGLVTVGLEPAQVTLAQFLVQTQSVSQPHLLPCPQTQVQVQAPVEKMMLTLLIPLLVIHQVGKDTNTETAWKFYPSKACIQINQRGPVQLGQFLIEFARHMQRK
jgi:hypothetical protein